MLATFGLPVRRTGEIRQALGRILLFLALFLALVFAGTMLVPVTPELSAGGLFLATLPMLAAALLAGGVLIRRLDGRPAGALGLAWTRRTPAEIGLGLLIGLGSIALAAAALGAAGALRYSAGPGGGALDWAAAAGRALGVLAVAALAEEVLFRGYAFQWLARAAGPLVATVVGSVAFAAAHLSNPDPTVLAVANLFLAGVLLSAAYLRTRSLWFATALHLGWNWGMAGPLDLPVSGLGLFDAPGYEPVLTGANWLTGGGFGPEGGVAATAAMIVALFAVLRLPGLDEAEGMRRLRPLVDSDVNGAVA